MSITVTSQEGAAIMRDASLDDVSGLDAKITALSIRETAAMRYIITKGRILMEVTDEAGNTALHAAARMGHKDTVALCSATTTFPLQPGLRFSLLNKHAHNGDTPLVSAIKENSVEVMDILVNAGANINLPCAFGWLPSHYAADLGFTEPLKYLAQKSAIIDAHCRSGDTPAHLAAQKDYGECIRILISFGANVTTSENMGNMTPVLIALREAEKNHQVIGVLLELGIL